MITGTLNSESSSMRLKTIMLNSRMHWNQKPLSFDQEMTRTVWWILSTVTTYLSSSTNYLHRHSSPPADRWTLSKDLTTHNCGTRTGPYSQRKALCWSKTWATRIKCPPLWRKLCRWPLQFHSLGTVVMLTASPSRRCMKLIHRQWAAHWSTNSKEGPVATLKRIG